MKFKHINPKYALIRVKDDMDIAKDDGTGVVKYTIHASPVHEESYNGGKYLVEQIGEVVGSDNGLLDVGDHVWLHFTWFTDARKDGLIMESGDGFIEALIPLYSIICKWRDGQPSAIREEVIVKQEESVKDKSVPDIYVQLWMSGDDRRSGLKTQVYGDVLSIGDQSPYGGWFEVGKRVLYEPKNAMKIEHGGEVWYRVKMADILVKEVSNG